MKVLAAADAELVNAAQEFLRKENPSAAEEALRRVSSDAELLPAVLEVHWEIQAQTEQWQRALETAESLRRTDSANAHGWLCEACSLNALNRTAAAFETLLKAVDQCPSVPTIHYNLACLACKLGRLPEASKWLQRAIEVGGRAEVKLMALDDPDLSPLLSEICAL